MLRIQQLKFPVIHTPEDLKAKMIKILRIRPEDLIRYEIIRKSLDARGGELKYVYLVDVEVKREPSVLKHCPKQVSKAVRTWYRFLLTERIRLTDVGDYRSWTCGIVLRTDVGKKWLCPRYSGTGRTGGRSCQNGGDFLAYREIESHL